MYHMFLLLLASYLFVALSYSEVNSTGKGRWMLEIEKELNSLRLAEQNARDLYLDSLHAQNIYIKNSGKASVEKKRELAEKMNSGVQNVTEGYLAKHQEEMNNLSNMINTIRDIERNRGIRYLLYHTDVWVNAGYHVSENDLPGRYAFDVIRDVPLSSYLLKMDAKESTHIKKGRIFDTRKTRRHMGTIDERFVMERIPELPFTSSMVDNSILFALQLKAVSELASLLDIFERKLSYISRFSQHDVYSIRNRLDKAIKVINGTGGSFKSVSQMASEVVLKEAKASTKTLNLLLHRVKTVSKLSVLQARHLNKLKVLDDKEASRNSIIELENSTELARDLRVLDEETYIDLQIESMHLNGTLSRFEVDTARALQLIVDKMKSEVEYIKLDVAIEAQMERDGESFSLERVKILGEQMSKEVAEAIAVIFVKVRLSFLHIVLTTGGKHQFLFYVAVVSLLLFLVMALKEILNVAFLLIQKIYMTPRLVREYGNISWFPWSKQVATDNICSSLVLESPMKTKVVNISSSAANACAPLRNILLHGATGCGKSFVAKSICSASTLPFAVLCGSDVAPLKRQGPTEIKHLLTWCKNQKRSILLVEEAESIFGSRLRKHNEPVNSSLLSFSEFMRGASEFSFARDVINVFLSLTGESKNDVMLILTTSNPEALDEAILDRMDEIIHLDLPSQSSRESLLTKNIERIFSNPKCQLSVSEDFNIGLMSKILSTNEYTGSFSARELEKLVQSLSFSASTDNFRLNKATLQEKIKPLCFEIQRKKKLKL